MIVNAANSSLLGGGGVDGAIHKNGGPRILEDCMAIRNKQSGCNTGEAVITRAGNLAAKFVIHTVGPVCNGGNNNKPVLLKNCSRNTLLLAEQHNAGSIVFPNISTGIYRFPKDKAVEISYEAVTNFLKSKMNIHIEEISFVCFDEENYRLYKNTFGKMQFTV